MCEKLEPSPLFKSSQSHNQGRSVRFYREGQKKLISPEGILTPSKLILCEIYHLISSFCLQKSYHTRPHQKQEISKAGGGATRAATPLNHIEGGATCPCPPPSSQRNASGHKLNLSASFETISSLGTISDDVNKINHQQTIL